MTCLRTLQRGRKINFPRCSAGGWCRAEGSVWQLIVDQTVPEKLRGPCWMRSIQEETLNGIHNGNFGFNPFADCSCCSFGSDTSSRYRTKMMFLLQHWWNQMRVFKNTSFIHLFRCQVMVAKKILKPSISEGTRLPIEPVVGFDTLNTLDVERDNSLGQIVRLQKLCFFSFFFDVNNYYVCVH